jgi:hypothetical protein
LVVAIENCNICILSQAPDLIVQLSYGRWVLSQLYDICFRGGIDAEKFPFLPDRIGLRVGILPCDRAAGLGWEETAIHSLNLSLEVEDVKDWTCQEKYGVRVEDSREDPSTSI